MKKLNKLEPINNFEPLVDENSQILILGSFPSVKSRENAFYYGNPQNRFWKVLASIFNEKVPTNIEEKIVLCKANHIALWDVVASSNLQGSSDLTLAKSAYCLSNIKGLLSKFPNIQKIVCNGKLAYKLLCKNFSDLNIDIVCLPSTSPANTSFKFEEWQKELI